MSCAKRNVLFRIVPYDRALKNVILSVIREVIFDAADSSGST